MITIIPSLEVLKAVTDKNIRGDRADSRRACFDLATELKSLADIEILIEGILYDRLKHRLNADHITFFQSIYKIDNSAKGVTGYNIIKAIKWIAQSEAKSRRVIVISENGNDYGSVLCQNIICISPAEFVMKVNKARNLYDTKAFSTLDDALVAVLFI